MYVHQRDSGHKFDLDNVKILMQENKCKPRKFIEGVFTKFSNHAINRAQDIPDVYLSVLK